MIRTISSHEGGISVISANPLNGRRKAAWGNLGISNLRSRVHRRRRFGRAMAEEGTVIACHSVEEWTRQLELSNESKKLVINCFLRLGSHCFPPFLSPVFDLLGYYLILGIAGSVTAFLCYLGECWLYLPESSVISLVIRMFISLVYNPRVANGMRAWKVGLKCR